MVSCLVAAAGWLRCGRRMPGGPCVRPVRRCLGVGSCGTESAAEIDHGLAVASRRALTRFSYSRRALRCAGTAGVAWVPSRGWQRSRSWRWTAGDGGDAQGVALAAPYGHAVVERGPLGGVQLGGAEEVGDLARHVEGDRQLRGRGAFVGGGVLGQEVGDGRADGAAADAVLAGEGGDGPAFQVRGAHGVGLRRP